MDSILKAPGLRHLLEQFRPGGKIHSRLFPKSIITDLASTKAEAYAGGAALTPGVQGILPIANGGTGLSAGMSNTWINITHQCQYHSRISPDAYTWIFYNPFLQVLSGFLYVSPGEAIPNSTILCTFPATVPYSAPRIFASLGESIADAGNIVGLSISNNTLIYSSSTGAGLTGAGHFPFTIPIVSG